MTKEAQLKLLIEVLRGDYDNLNEAYTFKQVPQKDKRKKPSEIAVCKCCGFETNSPGWTGAYEHKEDCMYRLAYEFKSLLSDMIYSKLDNYHGRN